LIKSRGLRKERVAIKHREKILVRDKYRSQAQFTEKK